MTTHNERLYGSKKAWRKIGDGVEAARICDRWAAKLGHGFHPDTRAKDYVPALLWVEAMQYDRDMIRLFGLDIPDPRLYAVAALEKRKKKCAS